MHTPPGSNYTIVLISMTITLGPTPVLIIWGPESIAEVSKVRVKRSPSQVLCYMTTLFLAGLRKLSAPMHQNIKGQELGVIKATDSPAKPDVRIKQTCVVLGEEEEIVLQLERPRQWHQGLNLRPPLLGT